MKIVYVRLNVGDIIDYSKRSYAKKCPFCGKKGEVAHYTNGGGRTLHKGQYDGLGISIIESCMWPGSSKAEGK